MAGERVRVEEVTTVSYGGGREMFSPSPPSWSAVWVGTLSTWPGGGRGGPPAIDSKTPSSWPRAS